MPSDRSPMADTRQSSRSRSGERRDHLLKRSGFTAVKIAVDNAWTISDLDLIAIGGFSPLTGFMNEDDYRSVLDGMRLADGPSGAFRSRCPWRKRRRRGLPSAGKAALVGERDGIVYAVMMWRASISADQRGRSASRCTRRRKSLIPA